MLREITSLLRSIFRRCLTVSCCIVVLLCIIGSLHVQSSYATPAYANCQEVKTATPDAGDGDYTLLVNNTATTIYCADMSTTPKEYISLVNGGLPYNFSRYAGGGFRPSLNGDVITSFQKVRIDLKTLQIDTTDRRFSSSSGAVSSVYPWMNYGSAGDCRSEHSGNGTGNVDLQGTPFHVSPHQFSIQGWWPNGYTTYGNNNQTVALAGGGACGDNHNGKTLQLYMDASLSVILSGSNALDVNTTVNVVIENTTNNNTTLAHAPRNSTMFDALSPRTDTYISGNLSPDTYTVRINAKGYQTVKLDGVLLSQGQALDVPVSLLLNSATIPAPVVAFPLNESLTANSQPLVSGTANANNIITILVDGSVAGSTTADGSGNWSLTPTAAMTNGVHTISAWAAESDSAGNTSGYSNSNTITVDTIAPAAPLINTPVSGIATLTNKPVISGTAEAFCTVTLTIDDIVVGTAVTDMNGSWSFTPAAALTEDSHRVQGFTTDLAGNQSVNSNSITFTCASSNGTISNLVLKGIALNETVTGSTYVYHANVPYTMDTTELSAVPSDPNAAISIILGGQTSSNPLNLLVGLNTIVVHVTAQNGTLTDYTILLTRAQNTNANLGNISLMAGDQEVVLPEAFDSNQLFYSVTVMDSVYHINLNARAVDLTHARLTVNNVTYEPGTVITQIALNATGTTFITITVSAQDTTIQKTYSIHVVKTSNLAVMNAKTDLTGKLIYLQFIDNISQSDLSSNPFIVKINGIAQEVLHASHSISDSNTIELTLGGKSVQIGDSVTVDVHQGAVWTADGITNLNIAGIPVENTSQHQLKTQLQNYATGTGKIHISEVMAWMKLIPHDLDGDGIFTRSDVLVLLQQIDPVISN